MATIATLTTITTKSESVYKKQQHAAVLASGYSAGKRRMETVSLALFGALLPVALYRAVAALWGASGASWLLAAGACVLGMAAADLVSGLVHWGCDTWGNVHTPLFSAFIRSFREHHVDPMAITRHDLVEANGDNCMLVVPALAALAAVHVDLARPAELFVFVLVLAAAVAVALTNQIHKWAHQLRPPAPVRALQAARLILSRRVHNIHHQSPYDRYYCITTGWLNPLLGAVDFWATLEAAVSALTANAPRVDDAFWTQTSKAAAAAAAH
jgi:plasmanylethanolamine desaturase